MNLREQATGSPEEKDICPSTSSSRHQTPSHFIFCRYVLLVSLIRPAVMNTFQHKAKTAVQNLKPPEQNPDDPYHDSIPASPGAKIGRHTTTVQFLLLLVSDCFNTSCPQIHLSSLSCLQNSADTALTIPLWSCCVTSENSNLTLHWGQKGSELNLNLTAPCARATI